VKKTVLITGAAGFLGRYCARHFHDGGWRVIGIDSASLENAPQFALSGYYSMQLPASGLAKTLAELRPNVCVHCAGRASVPMSFVDPSADFHGNVALTFETLSALRANSPECKFLLLSSAAVYGTPKSLPVSESHDPSPLSPYGFHKLQCEQLCAEYSQVYGLPTAVVRIFSAYGPGLRRQVVWDICQKAIVGGSVRLQGTGRESRDFIHARDIARALNLIATAAPMRGEVYNLGSGRETAIAELSDEVIRTLGGTHSISFDGVVPPGTPINWKADISRLGALGFVPSVTLESGLKDVVQWCRAELGAG
jgi:UDP-glucose 4-epimerase